MRIQLLTNEEKEFAEKNHYIVDRFLSYNHLDESDYYDVIIFGYLHAVQAYLRTPELAKYQFSTNRTAQDEGLPDKRIYISEPFKAESSYG